MSSVVAIGRSEMFWATAVVERRRIAAANRMTLA
jgi:hypothetical protein